MAEILAAGTEIINWRKFSSAVRNSSSCEARHSKYLPVVTETSRRILFWIRVDTQSRETQQ